MQNLSLSPSPILTTNFVPKLTLKPSYILELHTYAVNGGLFNFYAIPLSLTQDAHKKNKKPKKITHDFVAHLFYLIRVLNYC